MVAVNAWLLVVLIAAGLLVLAGAIAGFVFLILFVVQRLGGTTGGLLRLAQAYPAPHAASGQALEHQTVQIGPVVYRRCMTVAVSDEGLYLATGIGSAVIPWSEFKAIGRATLYWQKAATLTAGDPPVATIILPAALFEAIRARLPEGLQNWS